MVFVGEYKDIFLFSSKVTNPCFLPRVSQTKNVKVKKKLKNIASIPAIRMTTNQFNFVKTILGLKAVQRDATRWHNIAQYRWVQHAAQCCTVAWPNIGQHFFCSLINVACRNMLHSFARFAQHCRAWACELNTGNHGRTWCRRGFWVNIDPIFTLEVNRPTCCDRLNILGQPRTKIT